MSETSPVNPNAFDAEDFVYKKYTNGSNHIYAVDERGKRHHVSADDMLLARGYDPEAYSELKNQHQVEQTENNEKVASKTEGANFQNNPDALVSIQNARNYLMLELGIEDAEGVVRPFNYTDSEVKLSPEQQKVIDEVIHKLGVENFGLKNGKGPYTAEQLAAWEELERLLFASSDEFEQLYNRVAQTSEAGNSEDDSSDDETLDLDDINIEDDEELVADEEGSDSSTAERVEILDSEMSNAVIRAIEAKRSGDNIAYASELRNLTRTVDEYSLAMEELHGWDDSESSELLSLLLQQIDDAVATESKADTSEETNRDGIKDKTELLELERDLQAAREQLAALNVKVSGRVFRSGLLKEELAAAQDEWQRLQKEAGLAAIKYLRDVEGIKLDNIKELTVLAAMGAVNEAKLLAEKEAEIAASGGGGNKLQRMWRGYAKRYNEGKWYKKALYLAPVGILAGVAVGTIFGAVGGGLFGAAVAKGAVRGSILAKIRNQKSSTEPFTDESALQKAILDGDNAETSDEAVAARVARINTESTKNRIEKEVKGNRRKMLGSVAMGATIGAVSGAVAGAITNQLTGQHPVRGGGISRQNAFGGRPSVPVDEPSEELSIPSGEETIAAPPKLGPLEFAGSKGIDLGAPDAWPFKIAAQLGLSEQDSIELARQNGFSFREGMYWKAGRIMNPEEMKWHNIGLADIAAKRFQG